jgi:hypothetical protein
MRRKDRTRWSCQRADLGLFTFDRAKTYHMRIPDEEITVVVDCRPVASRIVSGLREHKSQLHVMAPGPGGHMTVVGWHASHEQIPPSRLLAAAQLAEEMVRRSWQQSHQLGTVEAPCEPRVVRRGVAGA